MAYPFGGSTASYGYMVHPKDTPLFLSRQSTTSDNTSRYDTPEQLSLLNRLYALLHWYTNFFLPVTKLKDKVQIGSRKKRIYDDPATPYARTLTSPDVSDADKAQLRETYRLLDLVSLRTQIDDVQKMLLQTVTKP